MRTPKKDGRNPVVDGARILQNAVPPPNESFAAGVEAHRNARKMDPAYGEAYELGEYIENDAHQNSIADLHGHAVPVAFPLYFRKFFARQDERRLAEWDELIDERLDREAAERVRDAKTAQRRVWRRAAWVSFGITVMAGKWIVDQIGWIVERLPLLKTIWGFITSFGVR